MITTCIFDAYGTLFDVASAARAVADGPEYPEFKPRWAQVANTWRLKQLQYTWLCNIMAQHKSFWDLTQDGLDFALEEAQINNPALRERLLSLYWELAAYPEVPTLLANLKSAGYNTGILSNGSKDMLNAAVTSAGLTDLLKETISIEDIGIYKPDNRVYQMVLDRFNCNVEQVLFVSSNGWDVAGSSSFGFQTMWVNRAGDPMDRLDGKPKWIEQDLINIPTLLKDL